MGREKELIAKTDAALGAPVTHSRIVADLQKLRVRDGEVLLVHSSLSSVGWICGGAETLIRALIEVLGSRGTLVMPTHSSDYSEPDWWEAPPVPEGWRAVIRRRTPGYDPVLTPTRGMGRIPELFRHFPGVRRSSHPIGSFAALGLQAERITAGHVLEEGFGEAGPLGRLYKLGGRVLLLGCGHGSNTSIHLAEHRAAWPGKKQILQGCPMIDANGHRVWRRFEELDYDADDFERCGRAFEAAVLSGDSAASTTEGEVPRDVLVIGRVGLAECRLMSQPALVDFATGWLSRNRNRGGEPCIESR